MESSQLGSVPTWESNLRIWKLEKTPNYSQDSYSWAISDLSRARKLKTFIKGRILWKKGFFSLLSFFLSLSSFFFLIVPLPESQIVFRMCKLEAD